MTARRGWPGAGPARRSRCRGRARCRPGGGWSRRSGSWVAPPMPSTCSACSGRPGRALAGTSASTHQSSPYGSRSTPARRPSPDGSTSPAASASASGSGASAAATAASGSVWSQMNSRIRVASGSRSSVARSAARKSLRATPPVACGPSRSAMPLAVKSALVSAARSASTPAGESSMSSRSTPPSCLARGRRWRAPGTSITPAQSFSRYLFYVYRCLVSIPSTSVDGTFGRPRLPGRTR